jgi:uncharacterized protein YdeI (YjbR/CyaY-like superfamily)
MEVTSTLTAQSRSDWRAWLAANHETATEIWLISDDRPDQPTVAYLDAVEEAICFGWIDGIAKRISEFEKAQRFTPRRSRSNWTELNKERARRLIRLGLMTDAGQHKLPDMSEAFTIAEDILAAINADAEVKSQFIGLPDLYIRVRIGYIEEMRKQKQEFDRRLRNFISKTAAGKLFGNWNDGGRLS